MRHWWSSMSIPERSVILARTVAALFFVLSAVFAQMYPITAESLDATTTTSRVSESRQGRRPPTSESETTTTEGQLGTFERIVLLVGDSFALSVLVLLAGAFVAGAVTRKIYLGDFSVRVGPFEIPAVGADELREALSEIRVSIVRKGGSP